MFVRSLCAKHVVNNLRRLALADTQHVQQICNSAVLLHQHQRSDADIDFSNPNLQKYLESLRQEFYTLRVRGVTQDEELNRMNQLNGIVRCLEHHRALQGNLVSKEEMTKEKDEDMQKLMAEENEVYTDLIQQAEDDLVSMLPSLVDEYYPSLIFEVKAGVGGQEAMLFARTLYDMYSNYFENAGWDYEVLIEDVTDIGGLRHANIIIQEPEAYNHICYEAGVHRVQRVPATEKAGRIHTSTASVTVIPRPEDIDVTISEKDLKIETKRASGAGGQHVNTTDSAVRVVHLPTGLAVESQTERSQIKNREIAIRRLQTILVQRHCESLEANKQATRKSQMGNLNRNEKIRTYNFVQDRVTDHRMQNGTVHNLDELLQGGMHLGRFMARVAQAQRKAKLLEMINSIETNPIDHDTATVGGDNEQKQKLKGSNK